MRVYAKWIVDELPEDLDDFHISCGVVDEQWDGYFISDPGARMTIEHEGLKYHVKLTVTVPEVDGLTKEEGWWLSPNDVEGSEAIDFGLI